MEIAAIRSAPHLRERHGQQSPLIGVIERSEDGGESWDAHDAGPAGDLGQPVHQRGRSEGSRSALGARSGARRPLRAVPGQPARQHGQGRELRACWARTRRACSASRCRPTGSWSPTAGRSDGLFVGPRTAAAPFDQVARAAACAACAGTRTGSTPAGRSRRTRSASGGRPIEGASFEPIYRMATPARSSARTARRSRAAASRRGPAWRSASRPTARAAACRGRPGPRRRARALARRTPARRTRARRTQAHRRTRRCGSTRRHLRRRRRRAVKIAAHAVQPACARGRTARSRPGSWRAPSSSRDRRAGAVRDPPLGTRWRSQSPSRPRAASATAQANDPQGGAADAATFAACPDSIPPFAAGLTARGEQGHIEVALLDASRFPPRKYANEWTARARGRGRRAARGHGGVAASRPSCRCMATTAGRPAQDRIARGSRAAARRDPLHDARAVGGADRGELATRRRRPHRVRGLRRGMSPRWTHRCC